MSAPLTQERIVEINAANSEYRAAREAVRAADLLVPIQEAQTVYAGTKRNAQVYRQGIDVPLSVMRMLIRDRQVVAAARLAAATRKLHQLNVQVPV